MGYDYKTLYQKNADFYNARPIAKKILFGANLALTAAFFLAYGGFVLFAFLDRYDPWEIVKILGVPAFCLVLVALLRMAIDRPRPYSAEGANITPLLHKKSKDKESFPSRHLACAFVISFTLLPYLPWAGAILLLLGFVLGYIRFALGVHYPSDLLGGAILGALCGTLIFIF